MYLVFTCMPDESYCRQFTFLLCLCGIFQALRYKMLTQLTKHPLCRGLDHILYSVPLCYRLDHTMVHDHVRKRETVCDIILNRD